MHSRTVSVMRSVTWITLTKNVNASRSRIRDTDYARETTAMTKAQILQQASTSVLAQAKQSPSAALSLLG
ncbi:flagellin [Vibrio cholerae]|uniref:flagellin n=1 Tax=Vibrio cholerae TaxID=666 RepID=UPI0002D6CB0A